MAIFLTILQGFISLASNIAGAAMALKPRSDATRRRFFWSFVSLAVATFGLISWQAVLSRRSGEEGRMAQLGDAEHPPYISILSLPRNTRFVQVNSSDFPAYINSMKLFDATHKRNPLRNYGPNEMPAHSGVVDNQSWIAEDDAWEHRFDVEISTRSGIVSEELILRRAGNDQWMKAVRVTQGMRTLEQDVDSAWPLDSNGQPDWN